jgi:hypothetical protein
MEEDTIIYVEVAITLKGTHRPDEVKDIIDEMDYSFEHEKIRDTEIYEYSAPS